MKTYDKQSARNHVIGMVRENGVEDCETDNEGQLIIHTGLYRWADNSIRDSEEPQSSSEDMPELDLVAAREARVKE